MIRCPECNSTKLKVTHTDDYSNCVIRRRKCKDCGHNFKTYEVIVSLEEAG